MSIQSKGPLFQDAMDPTRVVSPKHQDGKSTVCRIYWRTKTALNFGGEAPVPTSLFGEETHALVKRIGFYPVNS